MEPVNFLLVILLILLIFVLFPRNTESKRLQNLIDKLPGPFRYPLFGTALPFLFYSRNDLWTKYVECSKQYLPILRWWIGSNPIVSITLPEHVEVILNNSETIEKAFVYKFLHPWLGTGLLTSKGSKWHSHRKMITPTFHFKILENFAEVFSEQSEILVSKLQKEIGRPGFDVYPYISRCALDIICETAMGTRVHAQEDETSDYVAAVYGMSEAVLNRMIRFWLHPELIFRFTAYGRHHDHCLKTLHTFTKKVIEERKVQRRNFTHTEEDREEVFGKKKRVAFLDMLLEACENKAKLTDEEIREEVDTFMFEGHDTTTTALCWTLFLLGQHQDIQSKLHEEQQRIFQGSDRSVTLKDLSEMKYLERVIKESLRLYPSVPEIGRTLHKDIELGGYTIPAGVTVGIHIYLVHMNSGQFPNPEKFDPDNFLPERVAKRHPYAYIPFSAGPRNCIGQKFALLEEKTILSYVLRHYAIRSLDKREDIKLVSELILRSDKGIRIAITPRK